MCQYIKKLGIIKTERTKFFLIFTILKQNRLVYSKTLHYLNETNKIIANLHIIEVKQTDLF